MKKIKHILKVQKCNKMRIYQKCILANMINWDLWTDLQLKIQLVWCNVWTDPVAYSWYGHLWTNPHLYTAGMM